MRPLFLSTPLLALALAACGAPDAAPASDTSATPTAPASTAKKAVAMLKTADGTDAGTATITEGVNALRIAVEAKGLPAGDHGVHVHMVGKCDAPKFESAGSHWNPNERKHGMDNADGHHAGDLPNLTVADDGTGSVNVQLAGGTWDQLMDADGAAFVVHAKKDDQKTDPSGESGDRIACGAFAAE